VRERVEVTAKPHTGFAGERCFTMLGLHDLPIMFVESAIGFRPPAG
jgi:hypothetical protein